MRPRLHLTTRTERFYHSSYFMLACIFALFLINQFTFLLLEVPRVRLFERVICDHYYRQKNDPFLLVKLYEDYESNPSGSKEELCKIPKIQLELATVMGIKTALDAVPGLLTAPYFGSLADTIGRTPVVLLSSIGELLALLSSMGICYFQDFLGIRFVWLSSIFLFAGGGVRIFLSMLFSLISDTVPAHLRSRFMYVYPGIVAICGLSAPIAGAWLMENNIWRPFQVAVGASLLSLPILLCMPERWNPKKHDTTVHRETTSPDELDHAQEPTSRGYVAAQQQESDEDLGRKQEYSGWESQLYAPNLLLCYCMFFLKRLAFCSEPFVYQFVSQYLHWPLRRTTVLQLSRAAGSTLVNMIFIPGFSTCILSSQIMLSERLDRSLICVSASILTGGFCMLGLASTPAAFITAMAISGTGEGLEPALQGLAASMVDKGHTARMFTNVAFLDLTARIIGGPLMSNLLHINFQSSFRFEGFCFLLSALLFAIVVMLALRLDLNR